MTLTPNAREGELRTRLFHYPSSATIATKTIVARPGHVNVIANIEFSYDGTPEAGALITVVVNSKTILSVSIVNGGVGQLTFDNGGLHDNDKNKDVVVSLSSGGSGKTGKLSFSHY